MAKFHYLDPDEKNRDPFAAAEEDASEFEQLLASDTTTVSARRYRTGEAVSGQVVSIGKDYLFIDLGGKNAAALAVEEFLTGDAGILPKVGESVSAFVKSDNGSEVTLTKSLSRSEADGILIRNAFESGLPIEAKVSKVTKGGFEATVGNKRAFVPMGQMDIVHFDDPEKYVGNVFRFYVTEFSQGGRNLVLSRKRLLQEEAQAKVQELLQRLEVGQVKRATITRFAAFGAFADIGGVEGLIPLSEISWSRVKKPEDVLKLGESYTVKIIRIEQSPKLKIGLSLKDAGEDPWVAVATQLSPGRVVQGTVTRLADFGAFVAIDNTENGVEGMIHISQLTWEKRVKHPGEIVKVGQKVDVHVLSADIEARRLSLSLKGPMPEDLAEKLRSKKDKSQELSPEEVEQMREWESFKATQARGDTPSGGVGILADAFARARGNRSNQKDK